MVCKVITHWHFKAKVRRKHPISLADAGQALIYRTNGGHRMGLAALLALSFGLRRNECLALRWEDVNIETGVLAISERSGVRSIPIPAEVIDALITVRQNSDSDLVIPARD
jgi:integrase